MMANEPSSSKGLKPEENRGVKGGNISVGRQAALGAKITLSGQLMKFLLQFGGTILLARLLSPADFGQFAMALAIVGFAALLGEGGLSMATIQAKSLSRAQSSNLMWINLLCGTFMAGAIFLSADLWGDFYASDDVPSIIRWLSLSILFRAASAQPIAQMSRNLNFKRMMIIEIVGQGIALGSAVLLALGGFGASALVVQNIVYAVLVFVGFGIFSGFIPMLPSRVPMRRLLIFGVNVFGMQVLTYVSSNVDSVILGKTVSAQQLGIYDRAYQLFRVPMEQIGSPITRVVIPLLSRSQDDLPILTRHISALQRSMTYVLGAAFIAVAAVSTPLIGTVLGDKWISAAHILSILALGGVFQVLSASYNWTFIIRGKTGLQFRYAILTRMIIIVFILVGSRYGIIGVAVASSVGLAFNWLVLTLFPMRRTGIKVSTLVLTSIRPLVFGSTVGSIAFIVQYLLLKTNHYPFYVVLVLSIFALLSAGVTIFLLSSSVRKDILLMIGLLKGRQ